MQDFEKLGAFYLGKAFNPSTATVDESPLLYEAKDLTTHAVMVGMTGSGKTGLATALIEEAALDGIPSILIDPKGDLGNLLLSFPELRPGDFRPWIDESEALRKGMSPDDFAARTAESWRKGLSQWGQDGERIRRLRNAADLAVYTPGHGAGRPLQVLRSFAAPSPELARDASALRDRILSAVSGLLGLMGLDLDPVRSRDHILLSTILGNAWREGRSLDLPGIIQEVQKPSFAKIGVFDLETFYPAKERFGLAMGLNNILAAPGFEAWMEGEPLDIQRLLHTPEGKPRVSILYLAHLSEAERMFFVTILLNEVLAWMRSQSGTGSLRALLYMDEIFGYFPPTANPPSKLPMLTLLKQARAFGLGVVLSTQNPVDLDYKGLSNCGTWFIGRLQTERDKQRVIEGLEGAGADFDRAQTERLLAGLGSRVFLLRNVHEDAAVLFQTRWALSYLRGPLTLPQLAALNPKTEAPVAGMPAPVAVFPAVAAPPPPVAGATSVRPVLPPGIPVYHQKPRTPSETPVYHPGLVGLARLHYVDAKSKLDTWVSQAVTVPFASDGSGVAWESALAGDGVAEGLEREPHASASFAELPACAASPGSYPAWGKGLATALYQRATLELLACPALGLAARPGESEGDFRVRAAQGLREQRDEAVAKLKAKYAPRLQTLTDQLRRAEDRVAREKAQAGQQKLNTAISLGATLLGAFLGRGVRSVGNVGRASTAMRQAGRIGKEAADVARATEGVEVLRERLEGLQAEFEQEVATLQGPVAPEAVEVERRTVRPRKSDIALGTVGFCWLC